MKAGQKHQSLSRTIAISQLPDAPLHVEMTANTDDCVEVAARLGVPRVDRLDGVFEIERTADGAAIRARIDAALLRDCVVSLEPFTETICEPFEIRLARGALDPEPPGEIEVDLDAPEPLDGDILDLGEILVEQLSLAMDPYPQKPGAKPLAEEFGGETRLSPFSGLSAAFAKPGEPE